MLGVYLYLWLNYSVPDELALNKLPALISRSGLDRLLGNDLSPDHDANIVFSRSQRDYLACVEFLGIHDHTGAGGEVRHHEPALERGELDLGRRGRAGGDLSLIHISEPTRLLSISYAVFCLK